jgi:FlaA1/EpsC-like NDP-sugar epimerase
MIRIFNHYVHRAALSSMLLDLGLAVLLALGAVILQVGSLNQAMPMAGGSLVSFAAALFVINSASGLYEPSTLSRSRASARALFVLFIALPIAYLIFGLLPTSSASREAVQYTVMAGVSALVLRRAYVAHRAATSGSRTRILIFGAGPAAQVVGQTLESADPNAAIVGYVPRSRLSACCRCAARSPSWPYRWASTRSWSR